MACVPAPCRRARVFVRPFAFAPLSAPRNERIPSTPCKLPCLCGCTGRIVLGRSSECGLKARASKSFIRRMATAAIAGQQLLLQGQVPGASLLARSQKSAKCLVWMAAHFFHQIRSSSLVLRIAFLPHCGQSRVHADSPCCLGRGACVQQRTSCTVGRRKALPLRTVSSCQGRQAEACLVPLGPCCLNTG